MVSNSKKDEVEEIPDPSQWIELYGDFLYRCALARLGSPEAAEDVVQETFLSAYKSLDKFEQRSSLKTWLRSILGNKVIDYIRKNKKGEEVHFDTTGADHVVESHFSSLGIWNSILPNWSRDPETLVTQDAFLKQVWQCIETLPENLRSAFVFRNIDHKETQEICEELGISSQNFWVILYRSRMRLRKCLDANWFKRDKQ